jgi:hypothetical protein
MVRGAATVLIEYGRTLRLPDGTEIVEHQRMHNTVSRHDPANAAADGETRVRRTHHGIVTESNASAALTATASVLRLTVHLEVFSDGKSVFQRHWDETFPRRLL